MSIDVIDLVDLAHREKRRKNIFNTPRFHAWMHYYQYQLENAGSEPMIMMGNRSGPAEKIQIFSYETRRDIRQQVAAGYRS